MDAILVVNAGSSSLKFQIFATDVSGDLDCLVKGQLDGIGPRPRLKAVGSDKQLLLDQSYPTEKVPDLPAATRETGDWLRRIQKVKMIAHTKPQSLGKQADADRWRNLTLNLHPERRNQEYKF